MNISSYINSLNFPNELPAINDLLTKGQSSASVSFWGKRVITVNGYKGNISLDYFAEKVLEAGQKRSKLENLTPAERLAGIEITEKIRNFYNITDSQLKKKNWFTQFLNFIREFTFYPFTPRFLIVHEENFRSYSENKFVQEFGGEKRGEFDEYVHSDGNLGKRILARKSSILEKYTKVSNKKPEVKDKLVIPNEESEFSEFIQEELSQVKHLDKKLRAPLPGSWREHGAQNGEYNQTLTNFIEDRMIKRSWPEQRPLHVQRIGTLTEIDLKIIAITSDYLSIFHHVPVQLSSKILTMNDIKDFYFDAIEKEMQSEEDEDRLEGHKCHLAYMHKKCPNSFPRENGQYDAEMALNFMTRGLKPKLKKDHEDPKDIQLIAFTNEDLYAPNLTNFVFGYASMFGTGIWSKARFGDPSASPKDFQTCLLRMMKIAAHEFGHMREIPHCTDYECNIGGYMNLAELDSRPLLYCLQDTAKICYLTHTSLLEHHQKLLSFFENFNNTYQLNCDFSKEIGTLKKRISILASSNKK